MTPISDLIPLHNGQPGLRATLPVEIRAPSQQSPLPGKDAVPSIPDQSPVLDFISSDETLDRYHEIITPAGWDLTNYRRNPVFQNAHQYGDIIFTLGRALVTEIRFAKLFQRIQFATDANPLARIAHGLYNGKFLNAVSVGFIPRRWENGSQDTAFTRKYLEQELLEVSAVSIPANPNALALAVKSGAVEKSDLKNTADLINYTLAAGHAPGPVHQPSTINYQHLLALSRELRNLLRHL